MRSPLITVATVVLLASPLGAIPQNFGGFGGGGFFGAVAPPRAIDDDMTGEMIAASMWRDGNMPREWRDIPSLDGEQVKLLTVAPLLFGQRPQAIFANLQEGRLHSLSALYLDAGSHFGYKPGQDDIRTLKREFKKRYEELDKNLKKALAGASKRRPEQTAVGRTAFLKTTYSDYPLDELILRYSAIEGHSISITILRGAEAAGDYLDRQVAALDRRDRREALFANVSQSERGDTMIDGVPMFRQGMRPYCAISTLGMATHYLGLRMGTDALAAGARFRGTGSARGAKILDLYRAAADEAGASIQRGGSFDFERAKKAIDRGFPVIVWRRYSSARNRLHSAAARGVELPAPDDADREGWPTSKEAPGHSSVITGYNDETREVIFAESWGEQARGKRMRAEEMETTSYAVFYFKI